MSFIWVNNKLFDNLAIFINIKLPFILDIFYIKINIIYLLFICLYFSSFHLLFGNRQIKILSTVLFMHLFWLSKNVVKQTLQFNGQFVTVKVNKYISGRLSTSIYVNSSQWLFVIFTPLAPILLDPQYPIYYLCLAFIVMAICIYWNVSILPNQCDIYLNI